MDYTVCRFLDCSTVAERPHAHTVGLNTWPAPDERSDRCRCTCHDCRGRGDHVAADHDGHGPDDARRAIPVALRVRGRGTPLAYDIPDAYSRDGEPDGDRAGGARANPA